MAIPDYQTIMLPLLKLVKQHGDISLSKATTIIAEQFNLTEQEKLQSQPCCLLFSILDLCSTIVVTTFFLLPVN